MQGVAPRGLVVVVVGRVFGRVLPSVAVVVAVAATYRRAAVVVVVMGRVMIRILTRFLDPG